MKNQSVCRGKRICIVDFGRSDLGIVKIPIKLKKTNGNTGQMVNLPSPIQPVSERFPALEKQEITLTFFTPEARKVSVAGDFNNWRPGATPLKNTGAGKWAVRLMLRSGQYEYRFIVDGRWVEDPEASQRVANTCGGFNSVVMVPLADRTYIL